MQSEKMLRVLYADPVCYRGHKPFNQNILSVLTKLCRVSLFFCRDYFPTEKFHPEAVYEEAPEHFPDNIPHHSKAGYFLRNTYSQFRLCRKILSIAAEQQMDLVIFSCEDIVGLSLALRLTSFPKERIFFFEHSLYRLETREWKWLRFFWRHLPEKTGVILMEEYFVPFVRDTVGCPARLFLIHHPMGAIRPVTGESPAAEGNAAAAGEGGPAAEENAAACGEGSAAEADTPDTAEGCGDGLLIFAPSGSNDPAFVRDLAAAADRIPQGIRIVIRNPPPRGSLPSPGGSLPSPGGSLPAAHGSERLKVYDAYLTREEYEALFVSCHVILLPYAGRYRYQTSGVLFEAAGCGKDIYLMKGNTLTHYADKYPGMFQTFSDAEEFLRLLERRKGDYSEDSRRRFLRDYSAEELRKAFERLLRGEKYEK